MRFEGVTFYYDQRRAAVEDVSFEAEPDNTIALVGATGSASRRRSACSRTALSICKAVASPSTESDLRRMTLGLLAPQRRRRLSGADAVRPLDRGEFAHRKPDASDEEIALALQRAQADFIANQPDKLATVVGERGRSLSGRERQRVSIARALLKDPPS